MRFNLHLRQPLATTHASVVLRFAVGPAQSAVFATSVYLQRALTSDKPRRLTLLSDATWLRRADGATVCLPALGDASATGSPRPATLKGGVYDHAKVSNV